MSSVIFSPFSKENILFLSLLQLSVTDLAPQSDSLKNCDPKVWGWELVALSHAV